MGALFKMIESWITHFGLVMSAFGLVDLLDIIIVAFIIYKLSAKREQSSLFTVCLLSFLRGLSRHGLI